MSILLFLHILINNERSLRFVLDKIKQITGTDIQTSQVSFNGFTGYFTGDSLRVVSTKKKFELELGEFKLRLNASQFFLGKVEIEDIQTDKFNLKFAPKTNKIKKPFRLDIVSDLLDVLFLSRADLQNVSITAENKYSIVVKRVFVKAGYPLFFKERTIEATLNKASLQSEKFDLFIRKLYFDGTVSELSALTPFSFNRGLEGKTNISDALFAFSKKPNPWSSNPGYDASLESILKEAYGDTIPDNRTFMLLRSALIPFEAEENKLATGDFSIQAFDGEINGSLSWIGDKFVCDLATTKQIRWGLLPLGKSNLRLAYKWASFSLKSAGTLKSLAANNLDGNILLHLKDSLVYPGGPPLSLSLPYQFKNGVLTTENLKINVGDSSMTAKAKVDLNAKKLNASVNGSNIDSRAVVRLFSSIDIPGTANLSGTIDGELTNPQFNLKITSPKFGYESLTAGSFDGNLKINNQTLVLDGVTHLGELGQGKLKLAIDHVFKSSEQGVLLEASFNDMPAGELLNSSIIKGSVKGTYKLEKKNQVYSGRGDVHLTNGFWYQIPIQSIDFLLNQEDKYLHVEKLAIKWNEATALLTNPGRLTFHFLPDGSYSFEGPITPHASLTGSYTANAPAIDMSLVLKKSALDMLQPLVTSNDKAPVAAGKIKITYPLGHPENSIVEGNIDYFDFNYQGHAINLNRPTAVIYHQKSIDFKNTNLLFGSGKIDLNGTLFFEKPSNLKIKGDLDLEAISEFTPFLVEGFGTAKIDLEWVGPYNKPAFNGSIKLAGNEIRLRQLNGELTELTGEIKPDGEKLQFNNIRGNYEDSPLVANGWINYNQENGIYGADFSVKGKEFGFSKPDTWRLITDLDVKLTGSGNNLKLSGLVNLIDGTYFRDYSVSSFILKPVGVTYPNESQLPDWMSKVSLDLKVKSTGEFTVDNNVTEMALKGDITLKGDVNKPQINGTIDVIDGAIHAFGLDFEDARGFINFDVSNPFVPYIDFSAGQDIQNYLVKALIKGRLDNLELSFESQPALNKNEVVSLIAFGRTPDQLNQTDRNLFSRAAIASQIVSIIQRPLSKATHLDIVKLDSTNIDNEALLTEFSIGKKLSDRVTFAFTTDLSLDEAYKGIILEYQFLDNLLLKGSKDTGSRYRFNLTWRFEAY